MSHPAQLKVGDVLDVVDLKTESRIGIAEIRYTGEHHGVHMMVNLYSFPVDGRFVVRHPTDQTKK
jgi:hypothetical protein